MFPPFAPVRGVDFSVGVGNQTRHASRVERASAFTPQLPSGGAAVEAANAAILAAFVEVALIWINGDGQF